MSSGADRFIEQLSKREMLPEKIIKRLWDKVANSSSVPSARALATFLVDKGHLTREQADEALAASKPKRHKPSTKPKADRLDAVAEAARPSKKDKAKNNDDPFDERAASSDKPKRSAGKKSYKKKTKGDNEFDTPLMLLGGGGLVLGLLVIGGILYLLFSESGDQQLASARSSFESGSYTQAIQDYEKFLEDFSSHEGRSTARVTLAIARIRQIQESNAESRLMKAQTEVPAIEDEEEFLSVQEDLASLLPGIAKGLAERADAATDLEEIKKYTGLTNDAMVLVNNTKYLPSRLRDEQELNQIREVLVRIGLRQKALEDLRDTISAMNSSAAAGDTRTAYASHAAFVKAHPEKASDPELIEAVAVTSQAEKDGVRFVEESIKALKTEAKSAVTAEVAMADRRKTDVAPARGVTVVRFQGGAYSFDRRDGRLRWRRALGVSLTPSEPVLLGANCLLVDSARKELVLVAADSGELVWRTPLDDDLLQPVLLDDRVLVAGASGKLHVVMADSGERVGYVQFAQALRSPPVVYAEGRRVCLVGSHSSVYSLDAQNLSCLGVFYLGHAAGTVVAPPAVALNRILLVENDGASTSRLHVLGLDDSGVVDRELSASDPSNSRLNGLVTRPIEVFGKRFALTTESGYIGVYEVSSEDDVAVTRLATRESRRRVRSTPYTAVADQQLWVGGSGLSRYSIQPSGNRLPVEDIEEPFRGDTFVHPLRVADGVVIHVRRRRGRAGATVAASDLKTGKLYWETDIAVPSSGPPVADSSGGLLFTTASGKVFVVDAAAAQNGVTEETSESSLDIDHLLDLGSSSDGSGFFASSGGSAALSVTPDAGSAVHRLSLPGALAARPTRFKEGWLAPLAVGQVAYIAAGDGAPLSAPFQPLLAPEQSISWGKPSVMSFEGNPLALLTDGSETLFAIRLINNPAPHLSPVGLVKLEAASFNSPVGVTTTHAAAGADDGKLRFFSLPGLQPAGEAPLASPVVWGPHGVNGLMVVATSDNHLHAFRTDSPEAPLWSMEAKADQLCGPPLVQADSMLLSYTSGLLEFRALADGSAARQSELHQPIQTSPVRHGELLLVAAHDGALLFVNPTLGE